MPSIIYVEKTHRRREFTSALLNKFSHDLLVRDPKRVLVKPNVVSHEPYPTTTHPDVLDAVLSFLQGHHFEVVVADGPAFDAGNASRIIQEHTLQAICARHDLQLLNLHSFGFSRHKTASGFVLHLSNLALDCDYIISLPVLKPHPNCSITGALKNQFGLFPNRERLLMHSRILKDIHRSIAEVNTVARPHLTIVDAIKTYTHANEARHGGIPKNLGYMLAATDPVALDCHGLKLLGTVEPSLKGLKPDDIRHLAWAARLGVGSFLYDPQPLFVAPKQKSRS